MSFCSLTILLIFAMRFHQLVVLELASFLAFRAYFGSEYLEVLFPSQIILVEDKLVLVETHSIRVERPVIPIFEDKLAAEAH